MIQVQTMLKVADNTGAKTAQVIKIPGASKPHYAHIGQIVKVVIKEASPTANAKKATMHLAVIVRTKKGVKRDNGVHLSFNENACVIVKADKNPVGTRIFGPVARELKEAGFNKIVSLAEEVL